MLNKVREIGTNTFYYGLGNILNKSLGLILIPLYARHIPIEQYGVLAILELTILLLTALLNFGITSGHERFFFLEREKGDYGKFLFSNVSGLLLLSLLSLTAVALLCPGLSRILWGDISNTFLLILVMLITFIEINNIIPFQILQYEGKPVTYIVTNFIRLLISVAATLYFVVTQDLGIKGVLYGRLFGSGLIMIYQFLSLVIPRTILSFDRAKLIMTIKYGLPFTVSLIGYLIFASSDRYMLNWLTDQRQTGMYGFGYRISNLVMLLVQSIGIGYLPLMYQQEKQEDNIRFYRKMLLYYTFIMSFAILSFLFFYKILLWPLVRNKEYWDGLAVVPFLSIAFFILGMNNFVNLGITLKNKTRYYILPTFLTAIINIGLNYILIRKLGFMGAALSTLISQSINTCMITLVANHFMQIRFEWNKILMTIILAVLVFIAGTSFRPESKLLLAGVRITLLILFPFILYKLKLFESIEIQRIKEGFWKLRIKVKALIGI
jgi:O-antigen/teichoic acid export membrane protein